MKKKLFVFLIAAIAVISASVTFSACESAPAGTKPAPALQTGVKYYSTSYTLNENYDVYYIFYADGTAVYRKYHIREEEFSSYNADFTVKFKYTYADETAVVCFYDSIEYGEKHATTDTGINSLTTQLITVSENVLVKTSSYGYSVFVNENYLKTLTNFGK